MTAGAPGGQTLGWIGVGRMGAVLAARLLEGGCDLSVYNRTSAKADPLSDLGARVVARPVDLADRDIVITMVGGSKDFEEVMTGQQGLLADESRAPGLVIDASTVSMDVSMAIRELAAARGVALLAAPVSGNPKAARAGRLTVAVSGPRPAFEQALPYLRMLGRSVSYVGEGRPPGWSRSATTSSSVWLRRSSPRPPSSPSAVASPAPTTWPSSTTA